MALPTIPRRKGKIERWHQTLKNRILLENYFLPGDLEAQIDDFVGHYNHRRYHESLGNLTPADVYFGREQTILLKRKRIKNQTIETPLATRPGGCIKSNLNEQEPALNQNAIGLKNFDHGQAGGHERP